MEEKSPSTIINYNDVVVNPRKDLIVIVEPTEGVRGGRMCFNMAIEPIDAYVAQTVMIQCGGSSVMVFDLQGEKGFDITAWDPDTQELRVKIRDNNHYGIK